MRRGVLEIEDNSLSVSAFIFGELDPGGNFARQGIPEKDLLATIFAIGERRKTLTARN